MENGEDLFKDLPCNWNTRLLANLCRAYISTKIEDINILMIKAFELMREEKEIDYDGEINYLLTHRDVARKIYAMMSSLVENSIETRYVDATETSEDVGAEELGIQLEIRNPADWSRNWQTLSLSYQCRAYSLTGIEDINLLMEKAMELMLNMTAEELKTCYDDAINYLQEHSDILLKVMDLAKPAMAMELARIEKEKSEKIIKFAKCDMN